MGAPADRPTSKMNNKQQGEMQQSFLKRNSLMGDELLNFDPSQFEDEDWNVFDDDAPADSVDPSGLSPSPDKKTTASSGNNAASAPSSSNSTSSSSGSTFDSGAGSGSGLESIKRKQKKEAQVKKAGSGPPPPSWHSETADLPHRKAMVEEIARLLFARKKDNPNKKWLERLPLKARSLETQLYRNAASLEAYLDRKTLKDRLRKLASAITSHFAETTTSQRGGSRSSSNSIRSVPDSFGATSSSTPLDSLADARNRRSSTGGMSASGIPSAPPMTGLRREQSESAVTSQSVAMPGPPTSKLRREQSEPVVRSGMQGAAMNKNAGANNNSNIPGFAGNNLQAGGMQGMFQQGNGNGQMQQQFFSNMRQQQQQQNLANQMNPQANGNQLMAAQAAMMGGANGMAMMNQMQQQQNAMNMNMMQQQQNRQGMGMQNMMAFQQQQQQNAGMFMNGNVPNNNMNMMNNFNLPNVIPGVGANNGNFNQGMARDNMSMPPPMNANTPGRKPSGPDEINNSLSPNSFHW